MREDLELELVNKYPILYQDYGKSPMETCMAWGFECHDGWFDLLDAVSYMLEAVSRMEGINIVAGQVKQKVGTLQIYIDNRNCLVDKICELAETLSSGICELCGEIAETRRFGSYIIVLCDDCYNDQKNKRN